MLKKNFNKNSNYEFTHVALGGTFDRFHKGHKVFLKQAFQTGKKITIGITSDEFANKIHGKTNLQKFKLRKHQVSNFLKRNSLDKRSSIVDLSDTYGPTISDDSLEALVITQRTIDGAKKVNFQRKKHGKKPLQIVKIPLVNAEDRKPISSARIRKGEINKEGIVFINELISSTPLKLVNKLRSTFRQPFGTVISSNKNEINKGFRKSLTVISRKKLRPLICVGDVVTFASVKAKKTAKLSIIDFHVERRRKHHHISEFGVLAKLPIFNTVNKPGEITKTLIKLIHKSLKLKKSSVILVNGEEDLAALPVVLLAPLGSVVLYGHFRQGLVLVEVTEDKKSEALALLHQLRYTQNKK